MNSHILSKSFRVQRIILREASVGRLVVVVRDDGWEARGWGGRKDALTVGSGRAEHRVSFVSGKNDVKHANLVFIPGSNLRSRLTGDLSVNIVNQCRYKCLGAWSQDAPSAKTSPHNRDNGLV